MQIRTCRLQAVNFVGTNRKCGQPNRQICERVRAKELSGYRKICFLCELWLRNPCGDECTRSQQKATFILFLRACATFLATGEAKWVEIRCVQCRNGDSFNFKSFSMLFWQESPLTKVFSHVFNGTHWFVCTGTLKVETPRLCPISREPAIAFALLLSNRCQNIIDFPEWNSKSNKKSNKFVVLSENYSVFFF